MPFVRIVFASSKLCFFWLKSTRIAPPWNFKLSQISSLKVDLHEAANTEIESESDANFINIFSLLNELQHPGHSFI